jgi:peptide-methionine (S)-S-oxide reductase
LPPARFPVTLEIGAMASAPEHPIELATLAGGCFWCVEAVYRNLDGVLSVSPGYTGGRSPHPTYEEVCNPSLKADPDNHAEAIRIEFDPGKIRYEDLLDLFWRMHDPTTLNRQGADVGTQYRSAIFVHSEAQRIAAEESMREAAANFAQPIVTQIVPAGPFHPAEAYHRDYYRNNPSAGYCRLVIAPKLKKLGL